MKLKERIDELAIFGGAPVSQTPFHVGRPNIGRKEQFLKRVEDMLDRRWLTNAGPFVQEFEKKVADLLGVRHCIAMCNATVGLEIAIRALGMHDEVIVPSFTFVATAHALQWQEITPVFCDIDPRTHNLDPEQVEKMITPRTSGIIGVHVWGRPCAVDALSQIARKHNLKLLFDAAHAFACSHKGTMLGNFGHCEVLSFHATKFLNTFEGGAVVTNDDELNKKIRLMKNFGFAGYDNVVYLGVNGKMSEVSAAMGLTGLESLNDFITVNKRNYSRYQNELKNVPGFSLISYDPSEKSNCQYVVAEVDEDQSGLSRDRLIEVLHAENVLARKYFHPGVHRMQPYRSYFPHAGLLLPHTENLASRVLVLPTGTAVTEEEITAISRVIRLAVSHAPGVNNHLATRQPPAAGIKTR
ncbi:MAG TPA: aminotransferase class I/II-fold pyridoxal phosphate-dependent enzyme [Tepidisphaeraceae bacterium]|nr:aminotransferase class I/II-fold pyridoxal phosphate-dependent enzyme [Tepidisphaeraceae bacterium]